MKITLEQWRMLHAVVDEGGYARAAKALYRSQSSLSYAVSRIQELLGVQIFSIVGRKAVLTPVGEALVQRSRQLVSMATEVEAFAAQLEAGRESQLRLVVDNVCPSALVLRVLAAFAPVSGGTEVALNEVVLSGGEEAILAGNADIAIATRIPPGFLADVFMEIDLVAVAHPQHELHRLGRELTTADLARSRQVVTRDSGHDKRVDAGWLGAEQRWTVGSLNRACDVVAAGLGYAWLPYDLVCEGLAGGSLKQLPLQSGGTVRARLFLVYGSNPPGPATRQLGALFSEYAARQSYLLTPS